jgi:hypothetical protein
MQSRREGAIPRLSSSTSIVAGMTLCREIGRLLLKAKWK